MEKCIDKALDSHAIKQLIPHREPILLVDKVLDWQANDHIHAQRTLPTDEPLFAGHFPNNPIFPGVLQTEALAQASALLVNLTLEKTAKETIFLFMQIENARFKQMITPNCTLDLKVQQTKHRRDMYWFDGELQVNGTTCTTASFTAKHVLKPTDEDAG